MGTLRNTLVAVALTGTALAGGGFVATAAADAPAAVAAASRQVLPTGAEFVSALAARDFRAAERLLAPGVDFRALTPSQGYVHLRGRKEVMKLMREWYGTAERLERLETDKVLERDHVGYRIRWQAADGDMVFEQHAFYDVDRSDRIKRLGLVCSGDQSVGS